MGTRKTNGKAAKPKAKVKGKPKAKTAARQTGKPRQPVVVMPSHDEIAERAYEIWLSRGRPQGQDTQNWDEARRQLTEAD